MEEINNELYSKSEKPCFNIFRDCRDSDELRDDDELHDLEYRLLKLVNDKVKDGYILNDYFSLQIGLMHYWKIAVKLEGPAFDYEYG